MRILFIFFSLLYIGVNVSKAQEGILVNELAPLFVANDQNGVVIDLAKELHENTVVLLFYRGQWCPYCNRYMSALQDSLSMITSKGAKVIAITPEKSDELNKTIEKTNASFSVIYDENHKIMDAYDVTFNMSKTKFLAYKTYGIDINEASGNEDRALPVPATFIISQDGKVSHRHFDDNYKRRMSVAEILQKL